ncbi:MAG TPA: class I SAM-dependent methyltransferase [Puia sp.]|jgi:SAM-dependent methyltransferase
MKDVLGTAISDFYNNTSTGKLWVHNKYGPKEEMPVDVYFRDMDSMPDLEWAALHQCRGSILDIGAGAGSHALALQEMKLDITALDISPLSTAVMKARGVRNVINEDFFRLNTDPISPGMPQQPLYDTLLLLMNGIGLSGTLSGLRLFLKKARTLLNPGGQLIFDSSDIIYLYNGKPPESQDYYGEILYQYEYRRQRSDWFKWLFIDRKTLTTIATEEGWQTQLIFEDPYDQYLVRCRPQ